MWIFFAPHVFIMVWRSMKLGVPDSPDEIRFAQNKIEDLCVNFEATTPFLAQSSEELATDSARTQSMEGRDDPCKFWACEGGASDKCEQYDKSWANWATWLVQRQPSFAACVEDCDCPIGETRYTASKEGQFLITCCDDATQEIRLNKFGTPEAVPDASTGGWKLECRPKCTAPECGKWYCKGGGDGDGEPLCSEWTDGGSTPPEGVEFYADQSSCEQQSQCGKWWCTVGGGCEVITQQNQKVAIENNWIGEFFVSQGACQDKGCGKYYCSLLDEETTNNIAMGNCLKVDGVNMAHQEDKSIMNSAYLFESKGECEGSCGKYFCPGPGSGFTPTEEKQCRRVTTKIDKSSYEAVFSKIEDCGNEGCFKNWSCVESDCVNVLISDNDPFLTYYDTQLSCCQACNNCSGGQCPPGTQRNPSTNQCEPA